MVKLAHDFDGSLDYTHGRPTVTGCFRINTYKVYVHFHFA